jgi:peroxiredoxin Q/BCP
MRTMRALAILSCLCAVAPALAKRPEVGSPAPQFSVAASNGKVIKLADFAKKRTVVLAFFPKAFTGG